MLRFDKIADATPIVIKLAGRDEREDALLVGRSGSEDGRRITLRSFDGANGSYDWDIYRFDGHWAYGTSAERISVIDIDSKFAELSERFAPSFGVERARQIALAAYLLQHELVADADKIADVLADVECELLPCESSS